MNPVNLSLDFVGTGTPVRAPSADVLTTSFAGLDEILPDGGWPVGAISEIFCPEDAANAVLPLVLPTLARLSQNQRWLTWIAPPNPPNRGFLASAGIALDHLLVIRPHATTNGLWAIEQALRVGTSEAVLSWVNNADSHAMQDLRGAALAGNTCGLMFRPEWAIDQPSTAALRLRVAPTHNGLYIEVLKGTQAVKALFLETALPMRHSA